MWYRHVNSVKKRETPFLVQVAWSVAVVKLSWKAWCRWSGTLCGTWQSLPQIIMLHSLRGMFQLNKAFRLVRLQLRPGRWSLALRVQRSRISALAGSRYVTAYTQQTLMRAGQSSPRLAKCSGGFDANAKPVCFSRAVLVLLKSAKVWLACAVPAVRR